MTDTAHLAGTLPRLAESQGETRRRLRLPATLGGRTAFWLIIALMLVQAAGLTIKIWSAERAPLRKRTAA